MGLLDELKNLFTGRGTKSNNSNYLRNIIILGMIGTLLLLFGNMFSSINTPRERTVIQENNTKQELSTASNYQDQLEAKLEEIISLIDGVGRVRVQVYLKSSVEYEYEYNQNTTSKITSENDQSGGERRIEEDIQESDLVILRDSSGNEQPLIRRKNIPVVSGILIVAEGAENSHIKYSITRAVSNLLELPLYKINILPYEGR